MDRFLDSGWWETHFSCKIAGQTAPALNSQNVFDVALGPRLWAFCSFFLSRRGHQFLASKAVSHQPLDRFSTVIFVTALLEGVTAFGIHVDSEVLERLRSRHTLTTVVHLNGASLDTSLPAHLAPDQRRQYVVSELIRKNRLEIENLRILVGSHRVSGVYEVSPLWITNSVRVKANPSVIERLISGNHAESIYLDAPKELDALGEASASLNITDEIQVGWGVKKVGAPVLWEKGIRGKGVLVAMIDSGVNYFHPDLAPNMWKNPGESGRDENAKEKGTNGKDDDANGIIDDVVGANFEDKSGNPMDINGHGTQTAAIVGGAGIGGVQTGVAPEATLMAVRTCCSGALTVFESNTWEGLQYALQKGAKVISMSLSLKHHNNPTYAKWRRLSENILAAGVVHINSAGNRSSGLTPHNIGAPSSNPPAWLHPLQTITGGFSSMITIGATGELDEIRPYSSTGPVSWESIEEYKDYPYQNGLKQGLTKPDLCAPSEVPSASVTGAGYTDGFGGTSSAAPHVAGVAALLLSARPTLTPAQLHESLAMTSAWVDSKYGIKCGAGRVDASAALEYADKYFR